MPTVPPHDGEDQAFDEMLPDDPATSSAERQAHGNLLLSRRRAGEQKVGDVGAGNEQHDPDHAHQHDERCRELPPQVGHAAAGVEHFEVLGEETLAECVGDVGQRLDFQLIRLSVDDVQLRLRRRPP